MVLILAWLLFVGNSVCIFAQLGWIQIAPPDAIAFALLGSAWVVWVLLLLQYRRSLQWIEKMATGLQIDANRASVQKVKRKWQRMTLQVLLITILLGAYSGVFVLQLLQKVPPPKSWVVLGVWVVWMHSLIWFTLAWNRDQRLKHHLEREVTFELGGKLP